MTGKTPGSLLGPESAKMVLQPWTCLGGSPQPGKPETRREAEDGSLRMQACEPGTGHPVPPPLSSCPSGPWPGRHPKPRHSLGPCGRTGTWRHGASSHFLPKEQGQSGNFHPKETRVPLLRVLLPRPEGVSEVVVVLPQAAPRPLVGRSPCYGGRRRGESREMSPIRWARGHPNPQ